MPPLTFNRPYYTSPTKLVLAPLEQQRRIVLSKLRAAVPDPNERFIKSEGIKMKKARDWEEKQKRLEKEKKAKEKLMKDKVEAKRTRQAEERAKQQGCVNLRRCSKIAQVEERVASARREYNVQAHQTVKGRREFREEMRRRKTARKEAVSADNAMLKTSLAERVHNMTAMEERGRIRNEKLEEKKQEQERHALEQQDMHRGRIERLQKEAKDKTLRILESKKKLQARRKHAWQAELLSKGKIDRLNEKREENIVKIENEWIARRNKVSLNRASFVSRLDAVLRAASDQQMGDSEFAREGTKGISDMQDYSVDVNIEETSPLRSPVAARNRKRANTPVTPQDFFGSPDHEGAAEGEVEGGNDSSGETILKSNVTPFKKERWGGEEESDALTFDDIASPTAEIESGGEEEEEEEEMHIFSPSNLTAMKRGYSFSYTPSRVPNDDELERMSPLQRTYTAMKLSKGEDAGVLRMKELIKNATG
jgi:hypothetical protein